MGARRLARKHRSGTKSIGEAGTDVSFFRENQRSESQSRGVMLFNIQIPDELARHLKVDPLEIQQVLAERRRYYRPFKQIKPNGSTRVLYDIEDPLRLLQQKVKRHILDLVPLPTCVHGGVRCCSVVTNARPHVGKAVVFCLDIKNFYPSIRPHVVRTIFAALGFGSQNADTLTDITTWENHVPQGCVTSTALANLAMFRVDTRLLGLARQQGFAYTRWIDDLTLSGSRRLLDFRGLVQRIVGEEGFSVKPEKTQTMTSGMRQVVTGVVVNRKLNLAREERQLIRQKVLRLRSSHKPTDDALDRIRGKMSWLSQVNPILGARLAKRMHA